MIAQDISECSSPRLPIRYLAEPFYLDRTFLSGLAYYDYPQAYRAISVGDPLTLKREPENKHDRFAVAVYFCGRKLGYWPYPENKAIANMADQNVRVKARVVSIHPDKEEIYEALLAEAFVDL